MELNLQMLDWNQVNVDQLAYLTLRTRRASPLWVEGQRVEDFSSYIQAGRDRWPDTILVCAWKGKTLVGWLGMIREDPLLYELWRWHPFILPGEDPGPITKALLERALDITRENAAHTLEVCCHLRKDQIKPETDRYLLSCQSRYEEAGLRLSDEAVYLTSPVGKVKLRPLGPLPLPYAIIDYQPHYLSEIYDCFLRAFLAGQDRSFLNKTAQQQKSWFYDYLETDLNPQASKVLLEKERVIGFTLVQTRQRVGDEHLALIAVAPEYQGQGWGRKLISASLQAADLRDQEIFSTGVDLSNRIACDLYRDMGFKIQTKLITYTWKNDLN